MRENSGSWIIKFLLGLIVIAFVGIGVGSYGSKNRRTVATIGDKDVTIQEYQDSYKRVVNQLRARFGDSINEETLKMFNVEQQALDQIIENHLVSLEADKHEFIVSDEEIQSQLMEIDAFKENGKFNIERYQRMLALQRTNSEIFEAQIRAELRNQKVRNLVLDAVSVSDMEAKEWYINKNTRVTLDFLKFDPRELKDIEPTEEQIQAFYDEKKEDYKTEPKRVASFLRYSPGAFKGKVTIDKEGVEIYYAENQDEFKEPEKIEARHILFKIPDDADEAAVEEIRKKAMEIYEKAKLGENFAELAKNHSEGPSAASGGYLGPFARGAMVKPFEEAAFAMQPGDISEPVQTRFGWHIIKVDQRFEATVTSMEDAYKTIETKLVDIEAKDMAYNAAGQAFDHVIEGDDLEQVALLTQQTVNHTEPFSATGFELKEQDKSQFAREAFDLSLDTISDIKTIGDTYYLIKVTQVIEPKIQPLDQVRDKIVSDLTAKLQEEKAKTTAESILKEIKETGALKTVAQNHTLEVETTRPFVNSGPVGEIGASPDLLDAAFKLGDKAVHDEVIQSSAGFFVIALNEKLLPEEEKITQGLSQTRDEILMAKQNQVYRTWLDNLKAKSDIEVNPDFFN